MENKQFIVLGNPRGGTSLIAGTLIGLGVYMGQFPSNQYECQDFKHLCGAGASRATFREFIAFRDDEFYAWGAKLPNSVHYLDRFHKSLTNPFFIIIYRDIVENAKSSIEHEGLPRDRFPRVIQLMKRHRELVESAEQEFRAKGSPVLALNLKDCQNDLQNFTNIIEKFADLPKPPPEPNYSLLKKFLSPDGGYSRVFEDHQDDLKYYYKYA